MAWGSKDTSTQLTSVSATEQYFDDEIALGVNAYADIKVKVNHGGTTDDAIVSVYGTLDDSSETWDGEALLSRYVSQGTLDNVWFALRVAGIYRFRVGVKSTGGTDTHAADLSYRVATP